MLASAGWSEPSFYLVSQTSDDFRDLNPNTLLPCFGNKAELLRRVHGCCTVPCVVKSSPFRSDRGSKRRVGREKFRSVLSFEAYALSSEMALRLKTVKIPLCRCGEVWGLVWGQTSSNESAIVPFARAQSHNRYVSGKFSLLGNNIGCVGGSFLNLNVLLQRRLSTESRR